MRRAVNPDAPFHSTIAAVQLLHFIEKRVPTGGCEKEEQPMSMSRKWSQNPMAWAAAMALILPFAVGAVHAAEPAKPAAPSDAPVPPPTIDSDGDGKADAWDRDGNGKADAWDTNGDGKPDQFDDDGDGKPDVGR